MDAITFYHALSNAHGMISKISRLADENSGFMTLIGDTGYEHALWLLHTARQNDNLEQIGDEFIKAYRFYIGGIPSGPIAFLLNKTIYGKFESTRDMYDRAARAAGMAASCYRQSNPTRYRDARDWALQAFDQYAKWDCKADENTQAVLQMHRPIPENPDISATQARHRQERRIFRAALGA